jgi:ATP phosphoribosyltransferase
MKTRAELEQENLKIQAELAQSRARLLQQKSALESKDGVIQSKDAFIEQLKEALVLAHNRKFAAATESLRSLQSELFNESEQEVDESIDDAQPISDDIITVPEHQRKRGGRKPLPEGLPRIDVVHDLSDAG